MFLLSLLLAAAPQTVLTVFAAASLHAAFPDLGKRFEATHPGVTVRFVFNGSQALEAQLKAVRDRLEAASSEEGRTAEQERPPHY